MCRRSLISIAVLVALPACAACADDAAAAIRSIREVGPQAAGSLAARRALSTLIRQGPEVIPQLLAAIDEADFVAANWYRVAIDEIASRAQARQPNGLPRKPIEEYLLDARHNGRARRLALDLLDQVDPSVRGRLVPTLLDDSEFRDDAVAAALAAGDRAQSAGDKTGAEASFARAFEHARSSPQVTAAAARLAALGRKVNVPEHLGLIVDWYLTGPFPAPGMTGFERVFPPETSVDLAAEISSEGKPLRWNIHHCDDPLGTVDLAKAIAATKEAVGYAYHEFDAPRAEPVQIRGSADDCLAVWLNGEKVLGRAMWLNGTRFDRFIALAKVRQGTNRLLVKACQGPQHRDPSVGNAWTFQLRICDAQGKGLPMRTISPNRGGAQAAQP